MSEAQKIPPQTPYLIYLTKAQLDLLVEILSAPRMLGGEDIMKQGVLMETVLQAVPTIDYNNGIAQRVLKAQQEHAAKSKTVAAPPAEEPAPKPVPKVANTASTFMPSHPAPDRKQHADPFAVSEDHRW